MIGKPPNENAGLPKSFEKARRVCIVDQLKKVGAANDAQVRAAQY